jgi:hypothetical protein
MPITKHDVPSDPSQTVYPTFWGVVHDLGHEAINGLEPRDRFWKDNTPPSTTLSVAQALRRNNARQKGGDRS